jgi:hypothetical protein
MGNNGFVGGTVFDQMVAINPVWANEIIARDIPSFEDVSELLWTFARRPLSDFPEPCRPGLERRGRIDKDGNAFLVDTPEEIHVFVCGGLGSLHAMVLPGPTVIAAVARSCFTESSALAGREIDVRLPIHASGTGSPPGRHAGA